MEEKSFSGYLTNKLMIIITIIPFISWLITFITTNSLFKSLTVLFAFSSVILLISLYKKFVEHNKLVKSHKGLNEEHQALLDGKKEIERSFNLQSKEYQENIAELNLHKQVTHVVKTLVKADNPKTQEGKDLINLLRASTENIIGDGDKDGL
ncbi:hypothetical protein [Sporosarcina ureilytica]|uniref:Uncharacterized protein n=1 Tax=Sporosarcina ureilytica TaxID=298596 RepID=A0A1D8JGS7_9BACL|nr:hypothetical protein [Sporosarcina ureilytica]AOV07901.1 hypothetical protein BI350_10375 [Sporosarcina ureilytica]